MEAYVLMHLTCARPSSGLCTVSFLQRPTVAVDVTVSHLRYAVHSDEDIVCIEKHKGN